MKTTTEAYDQGQDAVRRQPQYAPSNPYDEETEKALYEAWDEGAESAGIGNIYSNGVLNLRKG